jgi:error-prone DNA polymerase
MEAPDIQVEEWDLAARMAAQQEILGASVEAHPLELLSPAQLAALNPSPIADALTRFGETVQVLGVRQTLQRFFHAGEMRYVLELEDLSGVLPVVLSPETYRRYQKVLTARALLLVTGEMQPDALWSEGVLVVQRVETV